MIQRPNVNEQVEREEAADDEGVTNDEDAANEEDAGTLDRSFKYAIIVYAVVEFFAIALLIHYKLAR
jgi:hypothetical protein